MKFTVTFDVDEKTAVVSDIASVLTAVAADVSADVTDLSKSMYGYSGGTYWHLLTDKGYNDMQEENAKRVLKAEYYKDVRDTAESIQDELKDQIKDGVRGEELREWLIEHIHETIDGSARIIYTAQAMDCIRWSDNDGAYFEEFGSEGAVEDGAINWSTIAFSAFERDVIEQLESNGLDVNNPDADAEDEEEDEEDEDGEDK